MICCREPPGRYVHIYAHIHAKASGSVLRRVIGDRDGRHCPVSSLREAGSTGQEAASTTHPERHELPAVLLPFHPQILDAGPGWTFSQKRNVALHFVSFAFHHQFNGPVMSVSRPAAKPQRQSMSSGKAAKPHALDAAEHSDIGPGIVN